jgi:hypothetical protein
VPADWTSPCFFVKRRAAEHQGPSSSSAVDSRLASDSEGSHAESQHRCYSLVPPPGSLSKFWILSVFGVRGGGLPFAGRRACSCAPLFLIAFSDLLAVGSLE